jgi:hypothetical protein
MSATSKCRIWSQTGARNNTLSIPIPDFGQQKVDNGHRRARLAYPGTRKIPVLADFSNRFFNWLDSLPADRP